MSTPDPAAPACAPPPAPPSAPRPLPPPASPDGPPATAGVGRSLALTLALLAVAMPFLLGGSVPPVSTFFNQVWSYGGAGAGLLVWAAWAWTREGASGLRAGPTPPALDGAAFAALAALGLLVAGYLLSPAPIAQRAAPVAALVLGAAVLLLARRGGDEAMPHHPMNLLLLALVAAGVLSSLIGVVQVFQPQWADGTIIAVPATAGRAVGNVRQPNQLSTLLLWSAAASVHLALLGRWPLRVLAGLLALLVFGTALTASRTGLLGVFLLAGWGLVDRRLPRPVRALLLASLPLYALAWWGVSAWGSLSGHAFFGESQIDRTLHGDASSSRLAIWRNTLAMIAAHPWQGVGFGRFNFVWTFTPFPDRPVAFFDHSHNLVLELAAEGGLPFAAAVLALAGWALWRARAGLFDADEQRSRAARTALFMLVVVGVHSQLEYPLWYAYFLLPTLAMAGWFLGLGARRREGAEAAALSGGPRASSPWRGGIEAGLLVGAGLLGVLGAVRAVQEYRDVAVIFEPALGGPNVAPLDQRIAIGRRSILFGQHADYALVTLSEQPEAAFAGFERPLFHLIDSRLMVAYARALAGRGQLREAAHVAARLREFRNPAAAEFFAECDKAPQAFQCGADPVLKAEELPLR